MRIVIIAMGSRGDVQPYVALGKGLHSAGHQVRLMTHDAFEQLVRKAANYQNARQLPYFRLQTILPPYASNIVVHDSQKAVSDAPLRVVFLSLF